jgi:cytochrome c peroxidase
VNPLERGSQVDFMADFEEMLDFPPAPKLDVFGKLDPAKVTQAEMRGQDMFFGKGQCASCHQTPYYTDNLMHDLKTERFFKPEMVNYAMMFGDGKEKTFSLRGVKDNPPYLHDEPHLACCGLRPGAGTSRRIFRKDRTCRSHRHPLERS